MRRRMYSSWWLSAARIQQLEIPTSSPTGSQKLENQPNAQLPYTTKPTVPLLAIMANSRPTGSLSATRIQAQGLPLPLVARLTTQKSPTSECLPENLPYPRDMVYTDLSFRHSQTATFRLTATELYRKIDKCDGVFFLHPSTYDSAICH